MESEEEILVHPKNTWKRSTIRRDIQVSYIYVYMYNNARQKICTPNYHQSSSWLFIFFSFKGGALDDTRCVHNQLPSVFQLSYGKLNMFYFFLYTAYNIFHFNFWSILYHKAVRSQSANLQPFLVRNRVTGRSYKGIGHQYRKVWLMHQKGPQNVNK